MFMLARSTLLSRSASSSIAALYQCRGVKMAAFSDPNFDFKGYLDNRPRYPDILYQKILAFHKGKQETVLDLGCGPGLSVFPLSAHFDTIIGTDPSKGMIAEAQGAWSAWKDSQRDPKQYAQIESTEADFRVDSAEELKSVSDASVDLVVAATAAHWFDMDRVWPQLARVLRPQGTVAFWCYGANYLPTHPSLQAPMIDFMCSHSSTTLGAYWPQPGRSILENLLKDIAFPTETTMQKKDDNSAAANKIWDASSATRVMHKLAQPGIADIAWTRGEAPEENFRMEHVKSFDSLNGYFRSSSASMRYYNAHPERKSEKPDMIERHVAKLRADILQQRKEDGGKRTNAEGLDDAHVRIAWPLGLMMIRKR